MKENQNHIASGPPRNTERKMTKTQKNQKKLRSSEMKSDKKTNILENI